MDGLTYSYATGCVGGLGGVVTLPDRETTPATVDPTKSYLAGGWAEGHLRELPLWDVSPVQKALVRYGWKLWDLMMVEDKVKSSVALLKASILADGITPAPAYRGIPLKDPQGKPRKTGATKVDEDKAQEIAAFMARCHQRLDDKTPTLEVAEQLLDGYLHGSMLAENVLRPVEKGADKGRLVPDQILVKPRHTWAWARTKTGEVAGIIAVGTGGQPKLFPLSKFTIFQWGLRNGDPSGSFLLDAAYQPWNIKTQLYPRYYKFLYRFAEPSLIGTAGEGAQARMPLDEDGVPIPGAAPISAVEDLAKALEGFQSGSLIALPFGSTVQALETHGTGEAFLQAFDYLDREMVFAILWQIRATLEAQHGSKADSETATDVLANGTVAGRQADARAWRKLYRTLTRLNFGDEAAELYTPVADHGSLDDEELIRLSNAIAKLCESGYLAESQLPDLDRRLKIPVRLPGSPRVTSVPAQQGPEGAKGGKPAQQGAPRKPEPKKP